ncbi:MAG TPA: AEC family transporter [Candidatus Choladousia intestinavium]|uniref:AEC family transporter n=1 Tax=Candidatus Choladousia intestinavium TaxID=2840727 RepID=A0A9D1AA13_9FIRM|nr:AEC family transporter [Candidatus Choladousia intestinavium]
MDIITLLFRQNVIMLIYLLVGYLLYKKKLLTAQGSGEMGKVLLYVIMPVAIIRSYIQEFSMEYLYGFLISFAAAALALILAMAVSTLIFGRRSSIRQFGAAFSNAGFIGIPLVQMTLGEQAVFYVASFVAILNILQWTFGVYVITKDKSAVSFKKIRTNPIVISFVIGILLFLLPIQVPGLLSDVIGTLASMNGPMAMIVLGAYLAQISMKELFTDKETYACAAVRLILIPLLTMLLLFLVPGQYAPIRFAVLLAAAAPVGSNVAIFAQLFHANYTDAVKDVCLSTVFSILTMPLILGLANYIW